MPLEPLRMRLELLKMLLVPLVPLEPLTIDASRATGVARATKLAATVTRPTNASKVLNRAPAQMTLAALSALVTSLHSKMAYTHSGIFCSQSVYQIGRHLI